MNDTEQIEKYLSGEMNTQEIQAFEMRLETDAAFAETYALYRSIENEMNTSSEENELRKNLSSLSQKHFSVKPGAKIIPIGSAKKKWWAFAAVAAASIALLVIWKPWQEKILSNQEVYAQNAAPDDLPAIVRGSNEDTILVRASESFNKKDYSAALPLLEKIVEQRPDEAQLQLSLGICYLQNNSYTLAIRRFDSLAAGQSSFKYDALFWKALTFLKQDKKDDCIEVLKQIPAEAKYKKAETMIRELSRQK